MARFTPRTIVWDPVAEQLLLLAFHGKDKYLLSLDDGGHLEVLRKVPVPSETFWVGRFAGKEYALFWGMESISAQPLAGGRGKKLKVPGGRTLNHYVGWRGVDWVGVLDERIFGFTPTRLVEVEAPTGVVWAANGSGISVYRDGVWSTTGGALRSLHSAGLDALGDTFAAAESSGHIVVMTPTREIWETKLEHMVFCVQPHAGRIYVWANHQVQEIAPDGTLTECGVTGEVYRDACLFSTPRGLFFLADTTIYRLHEGAWEGIDLEAQVEVLG